MRARIDLQRARDREELDHVDAALAAFVLGDEALRLAESIGELLLGEAGLVAGGDQQLDQVHDAQAIAGTSRQRAPWRRPCLYFVLCQYPNLG